ncbi:MAG: hypothetical protein ACXWRE_00125 [Pseudobdellovibrionaceae bacterium]
MKNKMIILSLLMGTMPALAVPVKTVKVCSISSAGQINTTVFHANGSQVTMNQNGFVLYYDVLSVKEASLRKATVTCGEKALQATEYVLSSDQGVTTLQVVVGASGAEYMTFPGVGVGASSENCGGIE